MKNEQGFVFMRMLPVPSDSVNMYLPGLFHNLFMHSIVPMLVGLYLLIKEADDKLPSVCTMSCPEVWPLCNRVRALLLLIICSVRW